MAGQSIQIEEIFQTAKQYADGKQEEVPAVVDKKAVRKTTGGYEGFKASEEDILSEKTMLLATEDINSYLID